METFVDDDAGYLEWNRTHFRGFVLNVNRTPTIKYLMLHRTPCATITGRPSKGDSWTHDPIKVCADTIGEIDEWSFSTTGSYPKRCDTCSP
jgi:hypothetical protein